MTLEVSKTDGGVKWKSQPHVIRVSGEASEGSGRLELGFVGLPSLEILNTVDFS